MNDAGEIFKGFIFASLSKTMMTHGESAAQTRRGILLSNLIGGQGHTPLPSLRHKTSKRPAGWVGAEKEANGR